MTMLADEETKAVRGPAMAGERLPAGLRLETGDVTLDAAWQMALAEIEANIALFRDGLLDRPAPVFMAGLHYPTPWTRDAAINVMNGGGLLSPDVARNTLLSVLVRADGAVRIGGQYWDAIIWVWGAWQYYLFTGDRAFLVQAFEAAQRSLAHCEVEEFDPFLGLFRGPACYGDGVAAYPDVYAHPGTYGCILDWPRHNPDKRTRLGYGLPMHALSTNCLYYQAYRLADRMAAELGVDADAAWQPRAAALKESINRHFWMPEAGRYRYLVDPFGGCDHQEGLGHAFAVLCGVAEDWQTALILRNQHVAPYGIPCVWPAYPRYRARGAGRLGRHSGTIWPHIQGFWAQAALAGGRHDLFAFELRKLAELACRTREFREIYHPTTGDAYGGDQEGYEGTTPSKRRQTWSATAYIRMVLMGLFGLDFTAEGVFCRPVAAVPEAEIRLRGLPYRRATLDIEVCPVAEGEERVMLNGRAFGQAFVPSDAHGVQRMRVLAATRRDRG